MKRTALTVASLLFLSAILVTIVVFPEAKATTLYVGGGGPGNYTTIQAAIDDASPGDSIYVYSGTYLENVIVNKTLSLVGESRDLTIIDGGGTGDVVYVASNWVNITGFTATNGGSDSDDAGIELDSVHNCYIANNNASNSGVGIYLNYSKRNSIIENIASSNAYYGIRLGFSYANNIAGNHASYNVRGIFLGRGTFWNNVTGNNASSNTQWGIVLYYADLNNVTGNNASSNSNFGISTCASRHNYISDNTLSSQNLYGIYISYESNYNTVSRNYISFNNLRGLSIWQSSFNRIYHNTFIDNADQASGFMGSNQWDDGYPSGGNYWSDYTGLDKYSGPDQNLPGSDGIGDTPHPVGVEEDRYPLAVSIEMIYPQPPEILGAMLSGGNLENVTITWSLSPDEVGPISVTGYEIYKGMTHDPEGLGYGLVASLPNGTSTFVDSLTGKGDPSNYFYRLSALNVYNRTAYAKNQAAKFTRPLSIGPNLISIPLIQSNESIETVLQTAEYDKAWHYDSSSEEWKSYMKFKGYRRGLWNINHTMGLWVNVTKDSNLTVAGVVPAQTTIHLYAGWNLVSFPSFNASLSVSDLNAEIGATRVEGYDPAPPNFLRVLGDPEVLLAGYGYWVRVESEVDWIVDVS